MDNRNTMDDNVLRTGTFSAPTDAENAEKPVSTDKTRVDTPAYREGMNLLSDDFAVGNVRKNVTEKTLKKRMARLVVSKESMILAILFSVSALLTFFRGYVLPVTLLLGLERCAIAATLWVMFFTAGRRGKSLLAWLPIIETVVAALTAAFIAAFTGTAMFAKQFLLLGQEKWVKLIYKAGMWAVVPALFCIAAAYCIYLFKRYERLLCCNIRDSLRYGFSFDKGSYKFFGNCIVTASSLLVLYIARALMGDFAGFDFLSADAASFFNAAFPKTGLFWLSFIGVVVHAAAIVLAGILTLRYGNIIKRFRHQRDESRKREAAERASIEELRQLEREKEERRIALETGSGAVKTE